MAETARPFEQNIIAMVWDFDKTLIRDYMQVPLFKRFGIDGAAFWKEVNALPGFYAARGIHVNRDTSYLNHILTYVKSGKMKGLSNKIRRPHLSPVFLHVFVRLCGQKHSGNMGKFRYFPDPFKQLKPTHFRHIDIQQHKIGNHIFKKLQSLFPGFYRCDLIVVF